MGVIAVLLGTFGGSESVVTQPESQLCMRLAMAPTISGTVATAAATVGECDVEPAITGLIEVAQC